MVHTLHIKCFDLSICIVIYLLIFLSVGLPVPVPQALADPEPADLDRVQCGFVPVILSAALRALEPHFVSGPYSLLQLLCPF